MSQKSSSSKYFVSDVCNQIMEHIIVIKILTFDRNYYINVITLVMNE